MAKKRPCVQCGVIFLPEFPKGAARTCSDECSYARRRATANEAGKTYSKRHANAIRAKSIERARLNPEKKKARWNAWAAANREHRNERQRALYAAKKDGLQP